MKRCARPIYRGVFNWPRLQGDKVRVRHAELAALVEGASVATKLTGTLSPQRMSHDAYLRWVPYRPQGAKVYAPNAAVTLAANVGSFLLLGGALGLWFGYRRVARRALSSRWFSRLLGSALAVGVATFLMTPRVASSAIEITRRRLASEAKQIAFALRVEINDDLDSTNEVF